jgi:RNA polymerase sigma factor (sigma-70 family)
VWPRWPHRVYAADAPPRSAAGPTLADAAERHLDAVHRYLSGIVGDAALAEELTAETFARAVGLWRRYDPARGTPLVYLCRIARSTALDHMRAEGRRRRRETRWWATQPRDAPPPAAIGLPADLRAALARLTPAEREVVALRVVLDLDGTAAAEVLGVSATACSSLLHRALTKLRREVVSP